MSGAPVTLDDACTHIVDCEHKTAPIDDAGSYYAVGTPAMRGNAINYAEARRINQSTFSDWTRRLRPMRGDLLFAREAPVGPLVRIPDSENVAPGSAQSCFARILGSLTLTTSSISCLRRFSRAASWLRRQDPRWRT